MTSELIRTFIAIELPDTIKKEVEKLKDGLMKLSADVKWVKSQNIHITLKFLGEITPKRVEEVQTTLQAVVASFPSFELSLSGIGAFPNLKRPRVFWVDVESGNTDLINLQRSVESELYARKFAREDRAFSPHLTIGRLRSPKRLNELIDPIRETVFNTPSFPVTRVAVIKSELQPAGPKYTVIGHAQLG